MTNENLKKLILTTIDFHHHILMLKELSMTEIVLLQKLRQI